MGDENSKTRAIKRNRTKGTTRAVKISNNQLSEISALPSALEEVMSNPINLCWLDLSFNQLSAIEDVLTSFSSLKTLYLHSNKIEKITEAAKLGNLSKLKQLTLHGNPVADKKSYRHFVIDTIPSLRQLDYSLVTEENRDVSYTWRTLNLAKISRLDAKLNVRISRQQLPDTWRTPGLTNSGLMNSKSSQEIQDRHRKAPGLLGI